MIYAELNAFLMRELRLMHAPVGMRFFFDQKQLENVKATQSF